MAKKTKPKRRYAIFHCPKNDDWIVCVESGSKPDVLLGVADCPDERTARVVLAALRGGPLKVKLVGA